MCLATAEKSLRAGFGRFMTRVALTYNASSRRLPIPFLLSPRRSAHRSLPGLFNPFPHPGRSSNQTFPMPYLFVGFDPEFAYPDIYQWNVSVEQAVLGSMVARVAYQGSTGRNLFHAAELNPAIYGPGADRTNTDRRRPRPEFTQLTFAGTYGRSNYHALVLSLERRMSADLTFLAGFSWQKTMDVNSGTAFEGNGGTHPYGSIDRDYAVSNFHRAARFTVPLTTSPSPVAQVLEVRTREERTGSYAAERAPLTIGTGVDNSFSGTGQDRVDIVGPRSRVRSAKAERIARWFKTGASGRTLGHIWHVGQNTERGPACGRRLRPSRIFDAVRRVAQAEFRFEVFNLFNRANLGNPIRPSRRRFRTHHQRR